LSFYRLIYTMSVILNINQHNLLVFYSIMAKHFNSRWNKVFGQQLSRHVSGQGLNSIPLFCCSIVEARVLNLYSMFFGSKNKFNRNILFMVGYSQLSNWLQLSFNDILLYFTAYVAFLFFKRKSVTSNVIPFKNCFSIYW